MMQYVIKNKEGKTIGWIKDPELAARIDNYDGYTVVKVDGDLLHGNMKLTPEQQLEAIRMRAQGKTYQFIADVFGVTRQAIHSLVKRSK